MSSAANRVVINTGMKATLQRDRLLGLKLSIVEGGRELAEHKLITPTGGNVSARIDEERFVVTPTGRNKGRLITDDLFEIEIRSHRAPDGASTEVGIHRAIYSRFHNVHAIVHAHPEKVLALADDGLAPDPSKLPGGGTILDRVAWIDDFPPGSRSLADEVARGLSNASALVLAAHGALAVGATVDQAVIRMIKLERLALLTRGG